MKLVASWDSDFEFCCGVKEVGNFALEANVDEFEDLRNMHRSGTGLFISTFVDTNDCKAAYELLTSNHTLLYQSPLRLNDYSNNRLFLCVFKYGKT